MDTLLDRLPRSAPGAVEDREAGREEVRQLIARAPTVYPAMLVSLWMLDEVSSAQAVATLLALGTPEAIEALRGFAFGRLGPDDARLHAALRLREEGHVDTRRGLLLWLDDRYQEVYPPRYELVDASEAAARPYPPEVQKLMARAVERHNAGELEAAAKLYRQVLAQDPDNEDAEQHLGLIDLMNGDQEAAEGHFARAFELNPDFVLARTTLASLRIGQRRLDEARQLLVPLADRTRFTVGELASYLFTSAELAAADGDPARARSQLRLLLGYVPDHAPARLRLRDLEREEAARKQAEQGQQGQQGPGGLASSLLQVPGRLSPPGRTQRK
jgi:tetratricopeptide (TPR) repeat protein